jgi:hypothetical protein
MPLMKHGKLLMKPQFLWFHTQISARDRRQLEPSICRHPTVEAVRQHYLYRRRFPLEEEVRLLEMVSEKIKIAIDRGGTFTDCIGSYKGKEEIVKLLSVDPNNYDDAPLEGIRRLLEKFTGKKIGREEKLDTSIIGLSSAGSWLT